MAISEREEYDVLDHDEGRIDSRPLYQCIHIYDTLDAREELQQSYQEDRRAQAYLILSSVPMFPFSLEALSSLMESIVGFLIIEKHVLRTTRSVRSEPNVDDLWDEMCERVVGIVGEDSRTAGEPEVFLGTKLKVLTFVQTLDVRCPSQLISSYPFIAVDLLGENKTVQHIPRHDLESFFYVLVWICTFYGTPADDSNSNPRLEPRTSPAPGLKKINVQVLDWQGTTAKKCKGYLFNLEHLDQVKRETDGFWKPLMLKDGLLDGLAAIFDPIWSAKGVASVTHEAVLIVIRKGLKDLGAK